MPTLSTTNRSTHSFYHDSMDSETNGLMNSVIKSNLESRDCPTLAIDSSLSEVDRAILEREATAQSRSPSGPSGAYQDK